MSTVAAPAPKPRPVRKPKPEPKKAAALRIRPDAPPDDAPAPTGHAALYRAYARAVRSARRAAADIEAFGWMTDEPECRGALADLERDEDGLDLLRFREGCLTIAKTLTILLDSVLDTVEVPLEVEFYLGRLDRPVTPNPRYPGAAELARKTDRERIVKRLGRHARPTAPA